MLESSHKLVVCFKILEETALHHIFTIYCESVQADINTILIDLMQDSVLQVILVRDHKMLLANKHVPVVQSSEYWQPSLWVMMFI